MPQRQRAPKVWNRPEPADMHKHQQTERPGPVAPSSELLPTNMLASNAHQELREVARCPRLGLDPLTRRGPITSLPTEERQPRAWLPRPDPRRWTLPRPSNTLGVSQYHRDHPLSLPKRKTAPLLWRADGSDKMVQRLPQRPSMRRLLLLENTELLYRQFYFTMVSIVGV